jgi:hypothetical protein
MRTFICLLCLAAFEAHSQLKLSSFHNDAIIYQTNEIGRASLNCEFGFCKKKVIEDKDSVVWMVLPECGTGEAELSKQKYKN